MSVSANEISELRKIILIYFRQSKIMFWFTSFLLNIYYETFLWCFSSALCSRVATSINFVRGSNMGIKRLKGILNTNVHVNINIYHPWIHSFKNAECQTRNPESNSHFDKTRFLLSNKHATQVEGIVILGILEDIVHCLSFYLSNILDSWNSILPFTSKWCFITFSEQ